MSKSYEKLERDFYKQSAASKEDGVDYDKLFMNGMIASWYFAPRPDQYELYQMLRKEKSVVTNCHRRWGKGTTTFVYIFERCHTEKIIVRVGGPGLKQQKEILGYLKDQIYQSAPHMAPKWKYDEGCYVFPSGSKIYVFGCKDEKELDKGRGTEAHIIYCDEYAFWRYKPAYVLESVLSPQLDMTDGQMIITSTPPKDLSHNYIEEVRAAEAEGTYFFWNIDQSVKTWMPSFLHDSIVKRTKGKDTQAYKREYLCELIPDKNVLVIPEAQDTEKWCGIPWERPEVFDAYVGGDLGFIDYTHFLFGYYETKEATLCIEGEYCGNYSSTKEVVKRLVEAEKALGYEPFKRIADNERQQLFDMSKDYGYRISPIIKRSKQSNRGFKESVINGLRVAIFDGRIKIDKEKCPFLYSQLLYGIWNERRTDFERTDVLGHLDGIMALAYLWDNIDFSRIAEINRVKYNYDFRGHSHKNFPEKHDALSSALAGKKEMG